MSETETRVNQTEGKENRAPESHNDGTSSCVEMETTQHHLPIIGNIESVDSDPEKEKDVETNEDETEEVIKMTKKKMLRSRQSVKVGRKISDGILPSKYGEFQRNT